MRIAALAVAPLIWLAACSPPTVQQSTPPTVELSETARSEMDRINASRFTRQMPTTLAEAPIVAPAIAEAAGAPAGETPTEAALDADVQFDAGLVRVQVLLDRAHFSPGVVDGYDGENVRKAVTEYQRAHSLPINGLADDALLTRLEQNDGAPALVAYLLTAEDVQGPFVDVPADLEAMSRLEHVGYASAVEAVSEKFHMDEDLLRTLNPGVDFTQAGAEIVVANAGGELSANVASIEVDIAQGALRAFDASNQLIAYYPATIGSGDAPAPVGEHTIRAVAFDPTYHYDPSRLPTFGARDHGALDIAAGPNNPVGAIWIALSAETYGIHGAPNPSQVSKTQSHGCIRLTNWDAVELGRAVQAGIPVSIRESSIAERASGRG